ncbi:hypothetical protein FF011L_44590 [Roseimaritima multifibrata]|uniref:Uncharacterized protein n=1 Tax=Roseimaritima multifibrata TaxID=1930274 RepID=A0A517MLD8_9BACT|nr:hypothetical protein [Roseimaritima multifibrata]QDS95660.1 hypothetical protein FF011L_44590 [Roseimaritima multifibrata]
MVDLDLSALSAPVEALRGDVTEAYKRLDARWEEVAEQLKKLPIPCTIGFKYGENPNDPEDYDRLEWRKWRGEKAICLASYRWERDPYGEWGTSCSVKLYDEWSAEQRLKMLEHVPGLFESAVDQVREFIKKTQV